MLSGCSSALPFYKSNPPQREIYFSLRIGIIYIENQKTHHQKRTFREEYIDFLNEFEVDYDERFIFKELI